MGEMIREHDWGATALGIPASWPQALKTTAGILLSSGYPMYIAWGPQFIQIYNDAYRPVLGSTKHPRALGTSTVETFSEIWDFIGPMFREVLETGRASTYIDQLLLLERHGFAEECYFTFSYSAIPSDDGVGGVLVTCLETTERVIQERRLDVLRSLLEIRSRDDLQSILQGSVEALARDPGDMPFVVMFQPGEHGGFDPASHAGIDAPGLARLVKDVQGRLAEATPGNPFVIELDGPVQPSGEGAQPVRQLSCIGISAPGSSTAQVVMVVGLSPRLLYAQRYEEFVRAAAANVAVVIAEAQALSHERRRATELAEIDRAKTVFFSDVSHEFRTPIALMIGPIEEAISATDGEVRDNLVIAKRNTGRLLKLVNSLLDFSRIEAGRMEVHVESVDLARFTVELASNFRSAFERAGLALEVDCPPLEHPVCIDPTMWEKIVLNLLSNAFKHTFQGKIGVRLREESGRVRLEICDTGIGISQDQVGLIFERFRRVPNVRSRTHEGSGIGLALVRELARMHGGDVSVQSREGEGSVFTVTIDAPSGQAVADAGAGGGAGTAHSAAAAAYIDEAMRWLPEDQASPAEEPLQAPARVSSARILVIDDNADMREYLARLISQRWEVRTCNDGRAALQLIPTWTPDVVISDVMMPQVDGFELIRRLRDDPATAAIPVILLSARAGEDARIDGLRAGADDYLVKPFTARDLHARVEAQLTRARARREKQQASDRLVRLFEQAPVSIALLRCPEFTYTLANPPYRELVARPDLIGKTVRQVLPELEGQGIFEALERVRVTQEAFVGNSNYLQLNRHGNADEGWFTFVFQPILALEGATESIMVVVYEVTELARAKQAAEAANFAKDEFLAMLGHELRNPLAPILTALQIMRLRDSGASKERNIIERQVNHLKSLVDDLLDVSRVTQGRIELKTRRVEIADIVAEALEQAAPLLEQRRHAIDIDIEASPSGLAVDGDEKRLAQILTNLVTNAAKFMPDGGRIRVLANKEGSEVVIRVIDEGIGIEPALLTKVFDSFFQARKTFDRSQGGLGLGLAIVRNLVLLHGGTVQAHSAGRDQGAEFVVRLPAASGSAEPAVPENNIPVPLPGAMSVLVVDDNEDAAETLSELLKLKGCRTHVAFDAASALQLAARETFDAAFLDLGLPGMNGYDLSHALWQVPHLRGLPVFALSGYGLAEDRRKTAAAGFNGHLVKPVSFEQMENLLLGLAAAEPPASGP